MPLAKSDGYPLGAVIYAAVVQEGLEARDYFLPGGPFASRPDCIYEFHQQLGKAIHNGRSRLHREAQHLLKDLGSYPYYRNGRILLSHDFRYFGPAAVSIPARLTLLTQAAESLGQGHRVFTDADAEMKEADALFRHLWKRPTAYTPTEVNGESYDKH